VGWCELDSYGSDGDQWWAVVDKVMNLWVF